jgi:hypothetical protein
MSTSAVNSHFGLRVQWQAHASAPSVSIFLQRLVRHANGMLSVTPACSSLQEMEAQIDELKVELDEMLRQAQHAFRERPRASAGA